MAQWTGTWLSGPASVGAGLPPAGAYRGARLGLPAQGVGSIAAFSPRAGAFVLDVVLAALLGGLLNVVVHAPTDVQRNVAGYVAFTAITVLSLALAGRTPGMAALGLRVLSLRDGRPALGLLPAIVRTVVLATFVLALVSDRDGRGLHDRLAGTVVVRA